MTELELYKFITDNEVEYHWHNEEVYAFVSTWDIEKFNELLGSNILDDDGIKCTMKNKYFAFEMTEICSYFGIEADNIFVDKKS